MTNRYLLFIAPLVVACGANGAPHSDGGGGILEMEDGAPGHDPGSPSADGGPGSGPDGGGMADSGGADGGGVDSGPSEGPISCAGPGTYKKNGGTCGSERWDIKTGIDNGASSVSLVPKSATIAQLVALPAAGGGAGRSPSAEKTVWELKDVTLTLIKLESDSDYHIVLSDASHSMIVEIPYPTCATSSAWSCFISRARGEIDAKFSVGTSPQYPALTVTVRGVGFFDFSHGQTGEAPNAIELHPVLQICFGKGCTPS